MTFVTGGHRSAVGRKTYGRRYTAGRSTAKFEASIGGSRCGLKVVQTTDDHPAAIDLNDAIRL